MLPVMAASLDVPESRIVLLATAYSLPFALMQLVFGPLGDAWGKTRLIRLSLAVVAASLVCLAWAPAFAGVLAARIVSGAFAGGINPVAIALVGENVALERRQVALGRYMVAMISGQMAGAAMSGVLVDFIGWRAVVTLAGAIVAIVAIVAWRFLDGVHEVRTRPSIAGVSASYRLIFARPGAFPLIAILILEGALILGLIPFVAGMLLQRLGSGPAQAGMVIGCFAIGGITFGLLVRRVVHALGPWHMVRLGGVLAGAGLIGAALAPHWMAGAACFFAVGFGFYTMHNTIMLRVTELGPHARGAGVSVGAFAFTAGQGLGPMVWAAASHDIAYGTIFVIAGALTCLLGIAAARLLGHRSAA